ncbi:Rho GTPase-activating protein 39, partial [Clonorchis sinensis]
MEEAQKSGNARRLFQLIRATGPQKPPVSETIKDRNGVTISNKEERLDRWAEYFEQQLSWLPAGAHLEPTGDVEPWTVNVEPPTASEVYDCICSLKRHRASVQSYSRNTWTANWFLRTVQSSNSGEPCYSATTCSYANLEHLLQTWFLAIKKRMDFLVIQCKWWELYDVKAQRNYYYNSCNRETVWQKPEAGDIIPLANLQDIGVLRRTVPKVSATTCTGRRTQHRKLPTSVLECRSRITQDLEDFAENRRHTQLTADDQQESQLPSDGTSQRIRDWLRGTNCTIEDKPPVNLSSGDSKGPGCLSDRPVRRVHQLPTPITNVLSIPAENCPSRTPNALGTNTHNMPEQHANSRMSQNGHSISHPVTAARYGLPHASVHPIRNSIAESQVHSHLQSVPTRAPNAMSLQSRFDNRIVNSSALAAPLSNFTVNVSEVPTAVSDHSVIKPVVTAIATSGSLPTDTSYPSISHDRSSYSSLSSVEPIPAARQRAFPRTNPSISRPPTAANSMPSRNPNFFLATTLDRPANASGTHSPVEPNTIQSVRTTPQRSAIPTSIFTPSLPLSPMFSSGMRPPNPIDCVNTETPLNSVFRSDSSTKLQHSPLSRTAPKQCATKQLERSGASCSTKSASSDSLHPSSSSSSFSRASSATALTNTTSEEASENEVPPNPATSVITAQPNDQSVPTMNYVGEEVVNQLASSYPPDSSQTNHLVEPEDLERPPIPPPRSASTLGQNRLHQEPALGYFDEFNQWGHMYHTNTVQSYVLPDQKTPCIVYSPRFHYFQPGPYLPTDVLSIRGAPVISSLSRNDPTRAHVIQPNHRRFTPFYSQCRPGFLPMDNSYYIQTSGLSPDGTHDYVGSSVEVSCTTPLLGSSCTPGLALNYSDGTVPTVVTSPSTTTTWVSHSTATWDGQQKSHLRAGQPVSQSDVFCMDSGNATSLSRPKRSPSGGFIGPEELNEPVWLTSADNKSTSPLQLPLYSLVHPGLPEFERFVGPFDWPKQLFKPEQDVANIMSWTKAKFTKRLLVSTDASLKKQVANIFKMIQSFMGDRKARLSLPDYGSIIIHRALNCVGLRDELFAQLCKQTTCNSDIKSLTDGWALLCVCLYYFPPNNQFRDPLKNYLSARAEAALTTVFPSETTIDRVQSRMESSLETAAAIASGLTPLIAAHFARVAPRWFLRSLNVGSRKFPEPPSIDEICHVKDFILKPCIFGSSLDEIMRIQAYRFPHLKLPWIQIFLTEELLRLAGSRTEGIFRLSPDLDVITELRCQLEKLFEIFRVTYNANVDDAPQNATDPISSDRFVILRPPPISWSASFSHSESQMPFQDSSDSANSSPNPSIENASALTGEYKWPVVPLPLSSPPSEYILLTPTAHWPRSLLTMAKQSPLGFSAHQVDAHLAAGLLKLWLRELAEPLVPPTLQPLCLKAAAEAELYESQSSSEAHLANSADPNPVQNCCRLIRKIPLLERRCLLYLILLLQRLAKPENASVSLMDPRNLATVIAPNLMRSGSTDPKELLENIRPQTLFVRLLISHLDVQEEIQALINDEQPAYVATYNPMTVLMFANCDCWTCSSIRLYSVYSSLSIYRANDKLQVRPDSQSTPRGKVVDLIKMELTMLRNVGSPGALLGLLIGLGLQTFNRQLSLDCQCTDGYPNILVASRKIFFNPPSDVAIGLAHRTSDIRVMAYSAMPSVHQGVETVTE